MLQCGRGVKSRDRDPGGGRLHGIVRYISLAWMLIVLVIIIIIIIFHSVCNLNGYDSRNITITFFPNLFQRLSIPKKA
jgi:hypothetical protein